MSFKNAIILIGILVVLAVAGIFAYEFLTQKNLVLAPSQEKSGVVIENKKISDTTNPFNIDIVYPYIAGVGNFNQKVGDIIAKQLADFKTYSLENDKAVKDTDPEAYAKYPRQYDFKIAYDTGQTDENITSIVLNIYAFTGGAHGSTNFIPVNYDLKNKKEIVLADLFSKTPNYVQKISDYCVSDLTKQVKERLGDYANAAWITQGAGPKEENFSVFLINKNNLIFYFPQYQIAAYSAGDFKVTMPR